LIDFSKTTSFVDPLATIWAGPVSITGFFIVRLSLLEIRVEVADPPSSIAPTPDEVDVAESVKVIRLPAILGTGVGVGDPAVFGLAATDTLIAVGVGGGVGEGVGEGVGMIPRSVMSPCLLPIELISEAPATSIPTQSLRQLLISPEMAIFPPEAIRVVFSNFMPVYELFPLISMAPPLVLIAVWLIDTPE
jgi:hypothetical protein